MDGGRLPSGQLGQPLGGTAGGGAQGHPIRLMLEQRQNGIHRGGFARTGATGQHQHIAGEGLTDRLPLQGRVGKALPPL